MTESNLSIPEDEISIKDLVYKRLREQCKKPGLYAVTRCKVTPNYFRRVLTRKQGEGGEKGFSPEAAIFVWKCLAEDKVLTRDERLARWAVRK